MTRSDDAPDRDGAPSDGEAYCPSCDRSYPPSEQVCPSDGTRLVDLSRPADPMLGRSIDGRFTIRERLGAGGMGVVYRAWQASVGREVAIKVIAPRPGDDAATAKRFLREARLASQLAQPNVVMVIDFGATGDGTLYLAMELLRGRTLSQVYRAEGRFPPRRAVRVATQLLDALEAAHRAGIVHRDLKPANVMILDEPAGRDFVKVLDFGLAKALDGEQTTTLTQSDRIVGTPSYMAPEVITGGDAEPRSDLYSVGVMLFEMLCGRLPYAAPNANVMLAKHAYAPVPELPGEVPPALAQVVRRLLAKAPAQRPASAAELRDALEAAAVGRLAVDPPSDQALVETGDVGVTPSPGAAAVLVTTQASAVPAASAAAPPGAASPASVPTGSDLATATPARPARRHLGILLAAIAVAGVAGAGIAIVRSGGGDASPPPERAPAEAVEPAAGAEPEPPAAAEPALPATAALVDAGVPLDARPRDRDRGRDRERRPDATAPPDAGVRATPAPDAAPPPRRPDAGLFVDPE